LHVYHVDFGALLSVAFIDFGQPA